MAPALSVIVPCFNEEANVPLLVERLAAALAGAAIDGEIVLVDDASRDRTRELIRAEIAQRPNVVGCYHDANRGIVGGWRTGLAAARGEYVVTIDADLQYIPEDVPRLYAEARATGADLVQGWRKFSPGNPVSRYLLSVGLSLFLNLIFWMRLRDIKSGFVLYRRAVFADVLDHRGRYRMFQHFITIAAHAKGYSIRQVPVTFDRRHAGESFITRPLLFSLRVLREIPIAFAEYRLRGGR